MVCFLGTTDSLTLNGDLLGSLEVTYNVMFAIGPKQQSDNSSHRGSWSSQEIQRRPQSTANDLEP